MSNSINVLLIEEIKSIAKQKSIDVNQIKDFLVDAIKRTYNKVTYEDNIRVEIDLNSGEIITNVIKIVLDENDSEFDETLNIGVHSQIAIDNNLKIGDVYEEHFDISKEFNQYQVRHIMQFFKQKITEISNQRVYESWMPMKNEVILAEIEKLDEKSGIYTINLENQYDKSSNLLEPTLGFLGTKEINPNEVLDLRKKYPFVVIDVKEQSKFCPIILSRTSEKLIEHLMTIEVPEIDDGTIKIVKAARIAGVKTKVLVDSKTLPADPSAICVGPKGERIKNISNQLNGEKIEIFTYSDNPFVLLSQVVSKNNLHKIAIDEENKDAFLVVNEADLSKVIGKKGSNVKLASMLTGYSINVITLEDLVNYSDYNFVDVNSYDFRSLNKKQNVVIEQKEQDETISFTEAMSEFEEILNDLDNNDLNITFQEEVKQILENEKNKI